MKEIMLQPGNKYEIEIGYKKGSYKTRFTSTNPAQIALMYRGINIGNGYKKRLKENGKVIARTFS